jgi:LemA protein
MAYLLLLAALVGLPAILVIIQYNGLVSLRNHIRDAWSNIDTELKRRHELIPNLVAAVRGYAAHEREILQQITELRRRCLNHQGPVSSLAREEIQLGDALGRLMVVVENYPTLKADRHFLQLQQELINTEDRIQAARRFYNGNVRDYRNKCEAFPSNLVAGMFGFESESFFGAEDKEREVPRLRMG